MLGRLFNKLFGGKSATHQGAASRPVSPPRPAVPSVAPPPPPPPPAGMTGQPLPTEAGPAESPATEPQPAPEAPSARPIGAIPTDPQAEDPLGDPFSDTFAPARTEPRDDPIPSGVEDRLISSVPDATSLPAPGSRPLEQDESQLGPPVNEGLLAGQGDVTVPSAGSGPEGAGGVRIILEDGTLARPSLDPELEERLRYIVDNIVPPSDPPSEGRAT